MDEGNQIRATARQILNVGYDLRSRLDALAREQGADGTYLGRRVLREYVEQHEQVTAYEGGSGNRRND